MRSFNVLNVCYQIDAFLLTFVLTFVCLHIAGVPNLVVSLQPVSGLCTNDSSSCSHQIASGNAGEECSMTVSLSSECDISPSEGAVRTADDVYGMVNLSAYLYTESIFKAAAINITFGKIKWTRLRMGFIRERERNVSELPFGCRTFNVPSKVPQDAVLFFDCMLNKFIHEGALYRFQYEATLPSGVNFFHTYLFHVPDSINLRPDTNIRKWKLFLVVEISDLRKLQLQFQVAPTRFKVTSYVITLRRSSSEDGNSWEVFSETIDIQSNITENTILKTLPYDTLIKPGIYKYEVEIIHNECTVKHKCISYSAEIHIVPNWPEKLLTLVVGFVLMVPLLITGYFVLRRSGICREPPNIDEHNQPKKILFIYNPKYCAHVDNVIGFYNFLKYSCNLCPLLDLCCIPDTETKNPIKWYLTEAFKEAKYILVLASPYGPQSKIPHRLYTYLHLDEISLTQLCIWLGLKERHSNAVSVQLPDCSWDTLPEEAKHLRRFSLPRHLDSLLLYLGSAPKRESQAAFIAALEQGSRQIPLPVNQTVLYTITQNVPETPSEGRLMIDPEGSQILGHLQEELKPLCNSTTGKSINLNL